MAIDNHSRVVERKVSTLIQNFASFVPASDRYLYLNKQFFLVCFYDLVSPPTASRTARKAVDLVCLYDKQSFLGREIIREPSAERRG